jgi:hypothetical protein
MPHSKTSVWPPTRQANKGQMLNRERAAKSIPIIRQDMLPARSSVVGIKRNFSVVTPASKVVCNEQSIVQWPPKQPTMASKCQYKAQAPASKVVIIRQDQLPARSCIAGIQQVGNMMACLPAKKHICNDYSLQWPPMRAGMHLRHIITDSVDDRRISFTMEDNNEQGWVCWGQTLIPNKSNRRPILTERTKSATKSLPISLCKQWRQASLQTAPVA